jgi:hypothetical protein
LTTHATDCEDVIEKKAAMVESILYSNGGKLYNASRLDEQTMETQIRSDLFDILCKLMQRRDTLNGSKKDRTKLLRKILSSNQPKNTDEMILCSDEEENRGKENGMLLDRILGAIAKIRKLRLCIPPLLVTTTMHDNQSSNSSAFAMSQQMTLPLEARNIFFNITLLSAFDYAPIESFTQLDWYGMLQQAEQTIHEYETWITSQNHPMRPIISCCTQTTPC